MKTQLKRKKTRFIGSRRGVIGVMELALIVAAFVAGALACYPLVVQAWNNFFKTKGESIGGGFLQMGGGGTEEWNETSVVSNNSTRPEGYTKQSDVNAKSGSDWL